MNVDEYFSRIVRPYRYLSAESADSDLGIRALAKSLDLSGRSVLLDFGCGGGRLLRALTLVRELPELRNVTYVGVDSNEAAVAECRDFFLREQLDRVFAAEFLTTSSFQACLYHCPFLVDYVVLVFTLHEMDVLNIDVWLATLWALLRRGGRFVVQDAPEYPHHEIEYLALRPEDVETILPCHNTTVDVSWVTAGNSQTRVFTLTALKTEDDYTKRFSTQKYLSGLHQSLLNDLHFLWETRSRVEKGQAADSLLLARTLHRVGAKARAYHQTLAFEMFENNILDCCLACGSTRIKVVTEPGNIKDPAIVKVNCEACGYFHGQAFESSVESGRDDQYWDKTLRLLAGTRTWLSLKDMEEELTHYLEKALSLSIPSLAWELVQRIPRVPEELLTRMSRLDASFHRHSQ